MFQCPFNPAPCTHDYKLTRMNAPPLTVNHSNNRSPFIREIYHQSTCSTRYGVISYYLLPVQYLIRLKSERIQTKKQRVFLEHLYQQ